MAQYWSEILAQFVSEINTVLPRTQNAPLSAPEPTSPHDKHAGHDHASGGLFGEKTELIFAILVGVFLAIGWLLQWREIGPDWLPTALYIAAYLFGGWFTAVEALDVDFHANLTHRGCG
ncbi:hypothetical protein [Acidovorax sp. SD340]|uniref:hypothetical protein n=1 Tax=Acidovorax sp. SD340 TaxID=1690268 RepID=UPI0006DC0333|nr:hypothetical protein [Acidovorax sp. SD340]KQB61340.1 hypothetical protein AE621_00330 [Acidovorax sp. SD340]MBO1011518.1 hypothetical protein [Acidovorax sp. SD340]